MPSVAELQRKFAERYRPRRMATLYSHFPITPETRVLDIGGVEDTWDYVPVRPQLTLLNLYPAPANLPSDIRWVQGDARDIPFQPGEFDLVFSNSVIEHVGSWSDQKRFADEVVRLGAPFWVQTPNYWFPIEPHVLGFGTQWVPQRVRRTAAHHTSVRGWIEGAPWRETDTIIDEVRLLKGSEVKRLFPDAVLWRERVGGITKSFVAARLPGWQGAM